MIFCSHPERPGPMAKHKPKSARPSLGKDAGTTPRAAVCKMSKIKKHNIKESIAQLDGDFVMYQHAKASPDPMTHKKKKKKKRHVPVSQEELEKSISALSSTNIL